MGTIISRYGQIADISVKYGLGIAMDRIDPGGKRRKKLFNNVEIDNRTPEERIRLAFEELGPTAVKFGQMAAGNLDPNESPELIAEFKKLHDNVAPVPYEEIRKVIEQYTGRIEDRFEFFEKTPIAAASIGQVHRAILKDGTVVVIKVQRPNIEEKIRLDTEIIEAMASRFEKINPAMRAFNLTSMISDFTAMMKRELDYVSEAQNADIFRKNFEGKEGFEDVKFPKIYWEYSGPRMIVMEYIEGIRVDDIEGIKILGYDPKKYAALGFKSYLKMIFEDGFFHIDPHPGNLFVTQTGQLAFIDLGAIAVVRPEMRHIFINLLLSIVNADIDDILENFQKLGVQFDEDDMPEIKDQLYYLLFNADSSSLGSVDTSSSLNAIPEVLNKYGIQIPGVLMSLLKVIVMVLGFGTKLDPNFNFYENARPYLTEIVKSQYFSPKSLVKTTRTLMEGVDSVMKLPKVFNRLMSKWASGKFQLEIVAHDVDKLSTTIERATNKVVTGVVVAAMVIGASIVMFGAGFNGMTGLVYLTGLCYTFAFLVGVVMVCQLLRPQKKRKF